MFVDDAQVVRADVMGTNGVLHVIDTVLVPDDGRWIACFSGWMVGGLLAFLVVGDGRWIACFSGC